MNEKINPPMGSRITFDDIILIHQNIKHIQIWIEKKYGKKFQSQSQKTYRVHNWQIINAMKSHRLKNEFEDRLWKLTRLLARQMVSHRHVHSFISIIVASKHEKS